MVADATRGVKFVLKTELDGNAVKPFEALEQHIDAIEKRLKGLTIPAPKFTGSNGAGGAPPSGSNGHVAGAANADKLARDRERAAERGFLTEAKWNRMAEAAVEKRSKAEEAAAKRAADVEKREIDRITKERQKALDEQTKADKKFWDDAIKDAKHARTERDREEEKNRRMLDKRLKDETKADKDFWDSVVKFGEDRAKFKQQQDKKEAQAKKLADNEARMAVAEHAERQAQLREGINATIDSVSKLARGFTQLGLIGETDMHRIANAMLGVQGTIDTVRGALDGFRQFGGFLGSHNLKTIFSGKFGPLAALSGGPHLGMLAHLLKAAGLSSFGVAGGVGLVGAGMATAGLGLAGALGTIADFRRGIGPGHVGGFWDTIGTHFSNAGAGVISRGLGIVGRAEAAFNSPYGLTSRERELRTENVLQTLAKNPNVQYLPGFGALGLTNITGMALGNMQTSRMERFTQEEIKQRGSQRNGREEEAAIRAPLEAKIRAAEYEFRDKKYEFEQAPRIRQAEIYGGLAEEAYSRRQSAYGEKFLLESRAAAGQHVDPALLERARRNAELEKGYTFEYRSREFRALHERQTAAESEREHLQERFASAKSKYQRMLPVEQIGPGDAAHGLQDIHKFSESDISTAYREMVEASEAVKNNSQEILDIDKRRQEIVTRTAQESLRDSEQRLAISRQMTDVLRSNRESATSRFGAMLPEQQRSLIEAAEAMRKGTANRLQYQRAAQFRELNPELFFQQEEKWAKAGGLDKLLKAMGVEQRERNAQQQEKIALEVTIKEREAVRVQLEEESTARAKETVDLFIPLLKEVLEHERKETARMIKEASFETQRRQNQEGGIVNE